MSDDARIGDPPSEPADVLREFCPACKRDLPLDEFVAVEGQPFTCRRCARKPAFPDLPLAPRQYQELLEHVLVGGTSIVEGARRSGISPNQAQRLLAGRSVPELRRAFQRLLEREGLDLFSIARKMRALFDAKTPKWNKNIEDWDYFDDGTTQLGVLKLLTRIHEVDSPRAREGKDSPINLVVITNLGDKPAKSPEPDNAYVVDVSPSSE